MAATAGHTKLRSKLIGMLLADRKAAIQQRNVNAQIAATVRIADLALRQAEEEAGKAAPVAKLTTVVLHAVYCPACRERQPATYHPPPPPPPTAAEIVRQQAASAWTEAEAEAAAEPQAAPAPVHQPEAVLRVPKTAEQLRRRRRDPIVRGLA